MAPDLVDPTLPERFPGLLEEYAEARTKTNGFRGSFDATIQELLGVHFPAACQSVADEIGMLPTFTIIVGLPVTKTHRHTTLLRFKPRSDGKMGYELSKD